MTSCPRFEDIKLQAVPLDPCAIGMSSRSAHATKSASGNKPRLSTMYYDEGRLVGYHAFVI